MEYEFYCNQTQEFRPSNYYDHIVEVTSCCAAQVKDFSSDLDKRVH